MCRRLTGVFHIKTTSTCDFCGKNNLSLYLLLLKRQKNIPLREITAFAPRPKNKLARAKTFRCFCDDKAAAAAGIWDTR